MKCWVEIIAPPAIVFKILCWRKHRIKKNSQSRYWRKAPNEGIQVCGPWSQFFFQDVTWGGCVCVCVCTHAHPSKGWVFFDVDDSLMLINHLFKDKSGREVKLKWKICFNVRGKDPEWKTSDCTFASSSRSVPSSHVSMASTVVSLITIKITPEIGASSLPKALQPTPQDVFWSEKAFHNVLCL